MKSGDPCERCGGRVQVVNTRVRGEHRIQYLGCRACGWRPAANKLVIPLRFFEVRATGSTDAVSFPAVSGTMRT